ncbi:MAG: Lipoprotein [Candidatus Midichloria mitochondrii]
MNKNYLLIFTMLFLTSCSGFPSYSGRYQDNSRDFEEKREPRDNQRVAGLKKNPIIIPDSTVKVGTAAKQNSQNPPPQKQEGFSQKMLNIAKQAVGE